MADYRRQLEAYAEAGTASTPNASQESGRLRKDCGISVKKLEGRTDLANARRLVKLYGKDLRYCFLWKSWIVWDGTRWNVDDTGAAYRLAKGVADSVWIEAMQDDISLDDEERSKEKALRFAAATASDKSIKAMLSLAQSELPILPDELDQNPWFLNCPNGTLDLRSGKLFDHRRQDFITKLCPTEYKRTAETYDWDRFMEQVHNQDDLIRWSQRWYGYCLTGDVREHVLPIYFGCGANGKSTEIEAYMHALGSDYAMKAPPHLLLAKKNDSHPTERADLFGKRFVACVETGDGRKLNEPLIKELTGGDTVRARRMRENFWEFKPSHKVILCTNHKPVVKGTDNAIWRRLRLNPFDQVFTEDEQDKTLSEKLKACAEGILSWAVQGCLEWQKNGLGTAAAMQDATQEYRSSQDVVGSFIAERCVQHAQFKVRSKQIFEEFEQWCTENGETEISRKKFGQQIESEGFERFTNNGVWYRGIAIGTEGTEGTEP